MRIKINRQLQAVISLLISFVMLCGVLGLDGVSANTLNAGSSLHVNQTNRNCTWSAASEGNWSTAGNWTNCGGGTPQTGDTVIFDGTSVQNSTIDSSYTNQPLSVTINSTYSGTITQSAALTITGNYSQGDNSTFTNSGYNLTIGGTTTIGGGTSGIFAITSLTGTKIFTGLVTVAAGGTWNNSGQSAVTFRGGITNGGTFSTTANNTITFDTNSQNITCNNASISLPNINATGVTVTNKCTGSYSLTVVYALSGTGGLTQDTDANLYIGGTSAITTLTVSASGNTVFYSGTSSQTIRAINYYNLSSTSTGARVLPSSGTLGIAGTFTPRTNSYTITGSTVDFNGTGAQTIPVFNYNNLTSSNSGARTLGIIGQTGSGLTITDNATPALAALSSTQVAFIDATNKSLSTYTWNGSTWSLVGSGLTITNAGLPALAALSSTQVAFIDATNDSLSTYAWNGSSWSLVGSGLSIANVNSPALARLSSTQVAFIDWVNKSLRTYTWNGSSWSLTGSGLTITGAGYTALAPISSTQVALADGTLDVMRTYTWSGSAWSLVADSELSISGIGAPALTALSSTKFALIDDSNDQLRAYDWNGSTWALDEDYVYDVTNVGSPAIAALSSTKVAFIDFNNDSLRTYGFVGGTMGIAGVFTKGSNSYTVTDSAVSFNGSDAQSIPEFTFNHLGTANGGTKTMAGAVTAGGNLEIGSSTTLDTGSSYALNVAGNWSNAGTFTANSSTVTLNGAGGSTQAISGATSFYELTATATNARTLQFEASSTTTITHAWTVTGSSGQLITLTSSSASQWRVDPTSPSISYVDVNYSNNISGSDICATYSQSTSGNNTNWSIGSGSTCPAAPTFNSGYEPHEDPLSDATSPTNMGGNVTFKATSTDTNGDQWYLAVCRTNEVATSTNAAPTCPGGEWDVSGATNSTSEAIATYTVTASETLESYAWYAFACDKTAGNPSCSAMSNSGTSGNNGSPFSVNHAPVFIEVSNDGPKLPAATDLTITGLFSESDTEGATDTVSMYVCKDDDFNGSDCGGGGKWCSVTGVAANSGSGWLTGYAYRVRIPVSATTTGAQTNYQKMLSIVQGSGTNSAGTVYLNSHALSWPNDIRFTKSDGTSALDFYREESDATDGTWHVELNFIGEAGNTDFYVYYGKISDSDTSNGANTFQFFDDFEAGNLDLWTLKQSQWSAQDITKYEGSFAAKTTPGTTNKMLSKTVSLSNSLIHYRASTDNATIRSWPMMLSENTPRSIYPFTFHETGKIMYYIGGASYADFPVSTSYAQDTWYSLEVAIDFSNSLFHWWVNGSDKGTAPLKNDLGTTLDISNSLTAVKGQAAATTANMYLDQVWVRNYTNPEPTWATPGVETASAGGASCDLTIPDPQAHGTIDFYTYIVDSHNTSASGGQQGALATFRVRDAVPTVSGTPSLNNTEPIDLINEESTTDIYVRGTVIDDNGCADTTASTTVDVWQTTLAGRSGCNTTGKADGNKCYYHMNCVYDGTVDPCEGGNDKTTSYKCTVPFQYYTNPTDTNTPWPTDSWTATFMPGDGQGPSAANESNTAPQEMNSFLALGLADSYNSISYGDLASGANTNPLLEKIRVKSTGNCSIDTNLSGTTMTGPGTAIPIANQRYGLGVGAPAWGDGVELSATSTLASVGVCKSGYALTPAWKPIWWGITIPSGQFSGAYTGTNTIAAVKKPWATTGDWCE